MSRLNNQLLPLASATADKPRWSRPKLWITILSAVFALAGGLPASADSITVAYTATKLSGSTWQYAYTLSGSVSSGDLLAIYFPASTSSAITALSTTTSDLTASTLQTDASIPADGEYDILATAAISTFPSTFAVTFAYSGAGTPGSQSFTLYDSSFATITSGTTTSAVTATAESGSLLLLGTGLLLFLAAFTKSAKWKASVLPVAILPVLVLLALPLAMQAQMGGPPGGGTPPTGGGMGPGGGTGGGTTVSGMTIGSYKLLSSYRASTYQYYYTYTTSVTSANTAPYTYVLGTLTSSNANTVVVSGSVEFGLVPAGGTATGMSTFTILQDRRYAFDPSQPKLDLYRVLKFVHSRNYR